MDGKPGFTALDHLFDFSLSDEDKDSLLDDREPYGSVTAFVAMQILREAVLSFSVHRPSSSLADPRCEA